MPDIISKRLHVSGLTAALSEEDIVGRFSSFGKVSSVTGFGELDANGDLKKFAHLTLEASEEKLKRGIGGISGTVWKGAKLRVSDAKPDYKERCLHELDTQFSTE
jgi:hypothetical protein